MAKTEAAMAAQQIRKVLKNEFPGVKFSVRSHNYAGGSAVYVEWNGDPERREVEPKVCMYEYGKFDGMTDSYDANNIRKDLPQVKYVQCRRKNGY